MRVILIDLYHIRICEFITAKVTFNEIKYMYKHSLIIIVLKFMPKDAEI